MYLEQSHVLGKHSTNDIYHCVIFILMYDVGVF